MTASRSIQIALLMVLAAPVAAAAKDPIPVTIDRAKVMRISAPAETVIIGNPGIADAAIYDRQTVVITGRTAGTTNLVILDAKGQPIADEVIFVRPPGEGVVSVHRGGSGGRQTYACTPDCNASLEPGDASTYFNDSNTQITTRNNLGNAAAGAGAGQ